jgi:hypothetical protein
MGYASWFGAGQILHGPDRYTIRRVFGADPLGDPHVGTPLESSRFYFAMFVKRE